MIDLRSFAFRAILLATSVGSTGAQLRADTTDCGWVLLFDGQTLDGWTTVSGKPVTTGWEVVDGELHLSTAGERGGNILTQREYTNFELMFEWRIAAGGNNGIKYRVRDFNGETLGLEYQIIDDHGHASPLQANQRTGAIYALYETNPNRFVRPAGEYNDSRIIVRDNCIEHWLNGQRIATATVGNDDWMDRVANSKFAKAEGFGQYRSGKIMLTDHNSEVWFRFIVLRPL